MAEQEQDQSEQATPFKLEEAKRRGQVAKSLDINTLFLIAGSLVVLMLWGQRFVADALKLVVSVFDRAAVFDFRIPALVGWSTELAMALAQLLAPFLIMVLVLGVLCNIAQTGPIFSAFPLKPDPKRLNPVQGFKNLFSRRLLFQAIKSFIKLILFSAVAYAVVTRMLPDIIGLIAVDPHAYPAAMIDHVSTLVFKIGLALLVVALLDLLYTRWDYAKKMRMSRRELKEEVKRREGDPHVRAKIKELQREAAKRSKSLKRVPEADVLITNPTHYAVALKYDRGAMAAPQVTAKGAGETALKMKQLAARCGVPVMERKVLARELFRAVDIDQPVPAALYEPIARLYAELYAARDAHVRGALA